MGALSVPSTTSAVWLMLPISSGTASRVVLWEEVEVVEVVEEEEVVVVGAESGSTKGRNSLPPLKPSSPPDLLTWE